MQPMVMVAVDLTRSGAAACVADDVACRDAPLLVLATEPHDAAMRAMKDTCTAVTIIPTPLPDPTSAPPCGFLFDCLEAPLQHFSAWAMLWSHARILGCETWAAVGPEGVGLSRTFVFLLLGVVLLVLNIVASAVVLATEHKWARRVVLRMNDTSTDAHDIHRFCLLLAASSAYATATLLVFGAGALLLVGHVDGSPHGDQLSVVWVSPSFVAVGAVWGVVSGRLWATRPSPIA